MQANIGYIHFRHSESKLNKFFVATLLPVKDNLPRDEKTLREAKSFFCVTPDGPVEREFNAVVKIINYGPYMSVCISEPPCEENH